MIKLCLQDEVEDTLDVASGSVLIQTLQQNGKSHGVDDYDCEFHVVENLPPALQILH